ncbi:hypothetical protein HanPSC8_Chr04g0175001 [Helianthus annuus]|nr:hypothetical protein HanPSC8_Chr04g0175001 [Helianthus annuus]
MVVAAHGGDRTERERRSKERERRNKEADDDNIAGDGTGLVRRTSIGLVWVKRSSGC